MADQQRTTGQEMASYLRGLARGLGPDLVGGPVDLARDALNLGIGGASWLGQKAGALDSPLPQIQPGAVGDSDWWARLTNVGDDQTPQYTAGRLTPIGASVAAAVASPVKRLVNAMASRPAPNSPRAQEGAIRLGGRPDLIASHSTSLTGLAGAQGNRTGTIELSNPSFVITKENVPATFGGAGDSVQLIPRVGAFDPATSPSTLFNRDAYTPRWQQFASKTVGKVADSQPTMPLDAVYGGGFPDFILAYNNNKIKPIHMLYEGLGGKLTGLPDPVLWHLDRFANFVKEQPDPKKYLKQLGLAYAGVPLDDAISKTPAFRRDLEMFGKVYPQFDSMRLKGEKLDPRQEAAKRLVDRLYNPVGGRDMAGRESSTTFGGGVKFGTPNFAGDVTGNLMHDIAIAGSPAFRSFREYEKSPKGAELLLDAGRMAPDYASLSWNAAKQQLARSPMGAYLSPHEARDVMDMYLAVQKSHGFKDPRDALRVMGESPDMPELSKQSAEFLARYPQVLHRDAMRLRQAYERAPSQYAELKVHGPVPVNAENFAGAIIRERPDTPEADRVVNYLKERGLQIADFSGKPMGSRALYESGLIPTTDYSDVERFWFKIADDLQKQAGPARKQPLR